MHVVGVELMLMPFYKMSQRDRKCGVTKYVTWRDAEQQLNNNERFQPVK